ncbi:fungal-specific transcription factor domain-containing protein [Aspergillus karnatakaensis]|uniref:Zn(II)2Cys6 transcription factor n=1 Tax=Aspergillus karnatakaensis TaxID=1810916 RepID=UPI003CCCFDEA
MSTSDRKEIPNSARSRRAARACARCHSRKVRCDGSITGFPCTNCRLDGRSCTLHSGKRDKEKQILRAIARDCDRSTASPPSTGEVYPSQPHLAFIKAQGNLKVPIQKVMDVFTKHYFLYVHPCLPVIDEAVFWGKYRSVDGSAGKISTLLFQAMLFAASSFVPIEAAKECGYDSLISARDDLYRRAKRLYEAGIEKDRLVISQAALLLTYYTTDAERSTNSHWLRIAIRYAKKERAHLYYHLHPSRKTTDLKRVWWCCIIRDRIISLGMRRPIQITRDDFDFHQLGLSFQDLEDECLHSEVYTPDTKAALFRVLASLCHLVAAVTDMIMLVYPPTQSMPYSLADRRAQLNRLEETKLTLLDWELTWVANPDGKEYYVHPSLTLYTNLCAIYFQSARIALCNRICLLIGHNTYLSDETDASRIESCRAELASAIRSTADNVKQLILNGVADKLPISAVAYTLLPQILLSIQTQLSTTPEDKQLHEVMLVFFTEVSRFLRSQYYMRLILAVSWKALELCRPAASALTVHESEAGITRNELVLTAGSMSSEVGAGNGELRRVDAGGLFYYPSLFQLKLTEYIRLLRYVDEFMSLRALPGDEGIYPVVQTRQGSMVGGMIKHKHTNPITDTHKWDPNKEITAREVTVLDKSDSWQETTFSNPNEDDSWTENYFRLYFGDAELADLAAASKAWDESSVHGSSATTITDSGDSTGTETGGGDKDSPRSVYGSEAGSGYGMTKEVQVQEYVEIDPRLLSPKTLGYPASPLNPLQDMLDCLPLLGE